MIKDKFPLLIFLAAILAAASVMTEKIMGRNLFYLSALMTVGYALCHAKALRFKKKS